MGILKKENFLASEASVIQGSAKGDIYIWFFGIITI